MENYKEFAYYYDSLMSEDFYNDYLEFILNNTKGSSFLELGCGTGTIALKLSKKNKEVIASDLSNEMIMVAKEKNRNKQNPEFRNFDMLDFNLNKTFDVVLCLCDSVNYLSNKEEVNKVFQNTYNHLNQNGYFVFDVHSLFKIDSILNDYHEEFENDEEYFYWEVNKLDEGTIEHFVVIEDKENDIRLEEKHIRKTYPKEEYLQLLTKNNFKNINVFGEFEKEHNQSERLIFIARKG